MKLEMYIRVRLTVSGGNEIYKNHVLHDLFGSLLPNEGGTETPGDRFRVI